MSVHERDKAGLHKEISSIFKGVPIPQNGGVQEPCDPPVPEGTDYTEPRPPTPEPQQSYEAPAPEGTDYTEPKPPASEPQQSYEAPAPEGTGYTEPKPPAPEPQQPEAPDAHQITQASPKAVPAQQPKAEPAQQPKVVPVQQPKADIDDIDKKISKKRTTVKISHQTFWQQVTNKLFTPKPGVSATRQKAMVVMVPLLFIVLIFVFRQVFGTNVGKTEAAAENNPSGVVTADSNAKIDWEIPAPYPTTLRDPMRLGPVAAAQTETDTRKMVKLIVKGILYSEDYPSAVVDNRMVHEGEKIRGVTVIKISKDNVEFEMNGKRWTQKIQ